MKPPVRSGFPARCAALCAAVLLCALFPVAGQSQSAPRTAQLSPSPVLPPAASAAPSPHTTSRDRRRAARLFLASSKLFAAGQLEQALQGFQQAADLDPANTDYKLAIVVARSHVVTGLIQTAAKDRIRGDSAAARAALSHALELDPGNIEVTQHLFELGEGDLEPAQPAYEQTAETIGGPVALEPETTLHSFHMRTEAHLAIQQIYRAYGLEAFLDESVPSSFIRLDIDNASFAEVMRALALVTNTFYVPLDPHHVLVARDTRQNRTKFMREALETLYLSGMSQEQMNDMGNLARNVFSAQRAVVDPSSGTITVHAPAAIMPAFNATMRDLLDGRGQVLLDVHIIQLAHNRTLNTGVQPPQSITAFNVYAEEQSILNANQSLVQQIISSGLASPGDTLTILGILLASGQVSSSLFSNGIALFGGGLTQSALSPGPLTANINLNSSQSRELDQIQLRVEDGQTGTIREGIRYPIQTSSFSSLSGSTPTIPGLSGIGSSSSLSSLLAEYSGSVPNIPQIQYQDLGMTLKATPNIMRNGGVALTIDLKIDALSGASINGNPILDNRSYSGVIELPEGQGVAVVTEMDSQQSRAISGAPGLSEIPGLNNVSDNNRQSSDSTLLIVMTPHVVRNVQPAGHTPMMLVNLGPATQ